MLGSACAVPTAGYSLFVVPQPWRKNTMGVAHLDYEDCAHVGVGFSLLHVSTDIHDLEVEVCDVDQMQRSLKVLDRLS